MGCNYLEWKLAGLRFSWVETFPVEIVLGGNCAGGSYPEWEFSGWELSGGNHLGVNFPGESFHVTNAEECAKPT